MVKQIFVVSNRGNYAILSDIRKVQEYKDYSENIFHIFRKKNLLKNVLKWRPEEVIIDGCLQNVEQSEIFSLTKRLAVDHDIPITISILKTTPYVKALTQNQVEELFFGQ